MNSYVRKTHSRKATTPVRALPLMMRQCIGAHEARTTTKWSFVSVREGWNGTEGGDRGWRDNKKRTQMRRSMHTTRVRLSASSCPAVLCRIVSSTHHPDPVGIQSSSAGFPTRRCIAVDERAAQAPVIITCPKMNRASLGRQSAIHATQEAITMRMNFMTSAEIKNAC